MASSPRIITKTGAVRRRSFEEKPIARLIVPPRAQASRRCQTQATLRRRAAKLRYRFGPLTPSARSGNLIAGDGRRTAFPLRTKNGQQNPQNNRLTGKAPYKSVANSTFGGASHPHGNSAA